MHAAFAVLAYSPLSFHPCDPTLSFFCLKSPPPSFFAWVCFIFLPPLKKLCTKQRVFLASSGRVCALFKYAWLLLEDARFLSLFARLPFFCFAWLARGRNWVSSGNDFLRFSGMPTLSDKDRRGLWTLPAHSRGGRGFETILFLDASRAVARASRVDNGNLEAIPGQQRERREPNFAL